MTRIPMSYSQINSFVEAAEDIKNVTKMTEDIKNLTKMTKGLLTMWLLSLGLFRNSGGETVNTAFIKKTLATSQLIFKPKSPVCHPRSSSHAGTTPSPYRYLSLGVQVAGKASQ